jgi:hypothetical protein
MAAGRVLSSISRFNPDLILRRKRGKAKTVVCLNSRNPFLFISTLFFFFYGSRPYTAAML